VPPLLVAEQVKVVPVVSVVTLLDPQPVWALIADSGSLTVQLMEMLLVYQPLVPSVPVTLAAITGGVVSTGVV
jgi:hypothetical protein